MGWREGGERREASAYSRGDIPYYQVFVLLRDDHVIMPIS